jgi:TPR repeat protein
MNPTLPIFLAANIFGGFFANAAHAKGNGIHPAERLAMDALRYDMTTPEIPHNKAEVARRYRYACGLGYKPICQWESWSTKDGGSLQHVRPLFADQCKSNHDPFACVVMGMTQGIHQGIFSSQASGPEEALSILTNTCEKQSYAPACTMVGKMHLQGVGTSINPNLAESLFEQACKAQDYAGCHALAQRRLQEGDERATDILLSTACRNGYLQSCMLRADRVSLLSDHPSQLSYVSSQYSHACHVGWTEYCIRLADLYVSGRGLYPAPMMAMGLYEDSCENGSAKGCYGMGKFLANPNHQDTDTEEAILYLQRACNQDHGPACLDYGLLRIQDSPLQTNVEEGLPYIQKKLSGGSCSRLSHLGGSLPESPQAPSPKSQNPISLPAGL